MLRLIYQKNELGRLLYNMTISQCIVLQNDFDKDNLVDEFFFLNIDDVLY